MTGWAALTGGSSFANHARRFSRRTRAGGKRQPGVGAVRDLPKLLNAGGPAEQIALDLVAKLVRQEIELARRFYTFRQHGQAETPPEAQHRAHDGCRLTVHVDRLDEGSVDLDLVERESPQVGQGGISGAEI